MSEYLNGEIGAIKDLLREIRDLLRDRPPERLYPRCATCARPVDRDHKDACELANGKGWVCSEACWEEFAAKCDRLPERGEVKIPTRGQNPDAGSKTVWTQGAEIARLRAEVERQKQRTHRAILEIERLLVLAPCVDSQREENGILRSEVERLTRERDRLREAIRTYYIGAQGLRCLTPAEERLKDAAEDGGDDE